VIPIPVANSRPVIIRFSIRVVVLTGYRTKSATSVFVQRREVDLGDQSIEEDRILHLAGRVLATQSGITTAGEAKTHQTSLITWKI
jgi:hypothetical protein